MSVAVVGADHLNANGGNRRSEIVFCDPGEPLSLIPEPKNPHDEHAIAVFSARNFQIGYIASQRAVYLKKLMRDGHEVSAIFQDVAPWGAIARVGIDRAPELPTGSDRSEDEAVSPEESHPDYPDPIWPED